MFTQLSRALSRLTYVLQPWSTETETSNSFGSMDCTARNEIRQQGALPDVFVMDSINSIDVFEMPIARLQYHLTCGSFTSKELTALYLERIRRVRLGAGDL